MSDQQCPLCYGALEIREVTPCFICGGSPVSVANLDRSAQFTRYRLPDGQLLVLCKGCELEEFMVLNGWGYRLIPHEKLPVIALRRVDDLETPRIERDKFCDACNLRLAFATVVASIQEPKS